MVKKTDKSVELLGIRLSGSSKQRVLEKMVNEGLLGGRKGLVTVVTPNPEQVVQAADDDTFRSILNQSTVAIPDGAGIVLAARLLLGVAIERMPGIEVAEELIRVCGREGKRVMLVGGKAGVAEEASHQIRNPKSEILNNIEILNSKFEIKALSGAEDISRETPEEREAVLSAVAEFRPSLVLIGYGAPWQEKWMWANRELLEKSGVRVAMVVGGAFDVWAGKSRRAPGLVRSLGMEWLWRLGMEPWRWKRQLRLIRFMGMVVRKVIFP